MIPTSPPCRRNVSTLTNSSVPSGLPIRRPRAHYWRFGFTTPRRCRWLHHKVTHLVKHRFVAIRMIRCWVVGPVIPRVVLTVLVPVAAGAVHALVGVFGPRRRVLLAVPSGRRRRGANGHLKVCCVRIHVPTAAAAGGAVESAEHSSASLQPVLALLPARVAGCRRCGQWATHSNDETTEDGAPNRRNPRGCFKYQIIGESSLHGSFATYRPLLCTFLLLGWEGSASRGPLSTRTNFFAHKV